MKPCDGIAPKQRLDCGYLGITQGECVNMRHCCWDESVKDAPWCFRSSKHKLFLLTLVGIIPVGIQLFRERLSNWKASKRMRQYRKAWWVVVVHCCIVKFTSFQRVGRRCYEYLFASVKRNKMDSELLTCLLKFIEYFPDCLSALSRTLLRFFWTTFVETAVYYESESCFALAQTRNSVCHALFYNMAFILTG